MIKLWIKLKFKLENFYLILYKKNNISKLLKYLYKTFEKFILKIKIYKSLIKFLFGLITFSIKIF